MEVRASSNTKAHIVSSAVLLFVLHPLAKGIWFGVNIHVSVHVPSYLEAPLWVIAFAQSLLVLLLVEKISILPQIWIICYSCLLFDINNDVVWLNDSASSSGSESSIWTPRVWNTVIPNPQVSCTPRAPARARGRIPRSTLKHHGASSPCKCVFTSLSLWMCSGEHTPNLLMKIKHFH